MKSAIRNATNDTWPLRSASGHTLDRQLRPLMLGRFHRFLPPIVLPVRSQSLLDVSFREDGVVNAARDIATGEEGACR